MTETIYTHELWYRNILDEDNFDWHPHPAEDGGWHEDETGELKFTEPSTLRADVEIDGANITLMFPEKVMLHDAYEYQLRPIAPD